MPKIINNLKNYLKQGCLTLGSYNLSWSVKKSKQNEINKFFPKREELYKVHIGPGKSWKKPGQEWMAVDVDPSRADIAIDFNSNFIQFPFEDESVYCIYGSHVFEHINIYTCPHVFQECYRILAPGGYFRLVLPDARLSLELYLKNDLNFSLFQRRRERAKQLYGLDYTLFECMKEDFLSRSGQPELLGSHVLAHQNAWDFETIVKDLCRAGFQQENIYCSGFQQTVCHDFQFEGTYPSEANEDYRSLYIEAIKR